MKRLRAPPGPPEAPHTCSCVRPGSCQPRLQGSPLPAQALSLLLGNQKSLPPSEGQSGVGAWGLPGQPNLEGQWHLRVPRECPAQRKLGEVSASKQRK